MEIVKKLYFIVCTNIALDRITYGSSKFNITQSFLILIKTKKNVLFSF